MGPEPPLRSLPMSVHLGSVYLWYDTASQRIDALEELRMRISSATDVKETLDLSARLQAEQAHAPAVRRPNGVPVEILR